MITPLDLTNRIGELDNALSWLESCTKDQVPLYSTTKLDICSSLLQHAQRIAGSILVLLAREHPNGAFALARPLFEGYVRGVWAFECAGEQELLDIFDEKTDENGRTKKFPGISKAIDDISTHNSFHSPWISKASKKLSVLHDWVHGGIQTCARNFDDDNAQPRYPLSHQLDLLDSFVQPIMFQSGIALLGVLDLDQRHTELTFAQVIGQKLDFLQ